MNEFTAFLVTPTISIKLFDHGYTESNKYLYIFLKKLLILKTSNVYTKFTFT